MKKFARKATSTSAEGGLWESQEELLVQKSETSFNLVALLKNAIVPDRYTQTVGLAGAGVVSVVFTMKFVGLWTTVSQAAVSTPLLAC